MQPTPQMIFVRGSKIEKDLPWMYFHLHVYREPPPEPIDLVYFDYPEGLRKRWNNWQWERRKEPPDRSPDESVPIEPKVNIYYEDRDEVDTSKAYPSVLGLYDFVKAQPPTSVIALHVFAHGYWDGPVLFNPSRELVDKTDFALDRDPHDTEFRRRDFSGKNPLAGTGALKFADAFSAGALIKLWGCGEEYIFRKPVHNYLKAPGGKKGDAVRKESIRAYLGTMFSAFPLQMSFALSRVVWAAPHGWGTSPYDPRNSPRQTTWKGKFPPDFDRRERWWYPPKFTGEERDFYRRVLGASIDMTRYVGYSQSWFNYAQRLAWADADSRSRTRIDSPGDLQQRLLDRIRV